MFWITLSEIGAKVNEGWTFLVFMEFTDRMETHFIISKHWSGEFCII